ncbi:hypothetical protein SGRI78S_02697 [Streptomyces griseus subsp. griseus]
MNAGENGYVSRKLSSSAPTPSAPRSEPSKVSQTSWRTLRVFSNSAFTSAADSGSFGVRSRACATWGRLRSSSVILSKRPEARFSVSWMDDSAAPDTSSPTSSRRSRWRAMNDTTGTARRASPPSTKLVILLASRATNFWSWISVASQRISSSRNRINPS